MCDQPATALVVVFFGAKPACAEHALAAKESGYKINLAPHTRLDSGKIRMRKTT